MVVKNNINVYTFFSAGYTEYANFLHKSLKRFESGDNYVDYGAVESIKWDNWPKGWFWCGKTKKGDCASKSHINAIDFVLGRIPKNNEIYNVFIDVDMCVLYKGWDNVIVKELDKVDCWGGGYNNHTQKIRGFPSPHLLCFKSELLKKIYPDFSMRKGKSIKSCERRRVKPGEENIYGRTVGANIKCDTGWYLPMQFHKAGLTWSAMEMLYSKFSNVLLPFKDQKQKEDCEKDNSFYQQSEWHYNNKLFAAHKKTYILAPAHRFNAKYGKIWRERIDMYTEKEFGFVL